MNLQRWLGLGLALLTPALHLAAARQEPEVSSSLQLVSIGTK